MKRIAIMGCSGSGKSTLARKLAHVTKLPLIHLDQEYHLPNWVERGKQDWEKIHTNLIARENWIIDGNYSDIAKERVERANIVIFFDYSTWFCLYRVIKRIVLNYGRERPDSAIGCKERFDIDFLLYVLKFRRKRRKKLYNIFEQRAEDSELFIVKSNKDLQKVHLRFDIR